MQGRFAPSGEPFVVCPADCGDVGGHFATQGEPFDICPTACRSKGDDPKGGRGQSKIRTKVRTSPARS